jgi:hypothetical protein
VVREDRDLRVVAAIELISPANKDRPDSRRAFAATCSRVEGDKRIERPKLWSRRARTWLYAELADEGQE